MTSLEILALIFALLILVKVVVVLIKPKKWMGFATAVWRQGPILTVIYVILTVLTGYYVLSNLTIVDVGAVLLFTSLLMALTAVPYAKKILEIKNGLDDKNLIKKSWLPLLIWVAIAVWIIYALVV